MARRLILFPFALLLSLVASLIASYMVAIRPLRRTWGVDPDETDRTLPGDDVVADPGIIDTRGITVEAVPAAAWPWLVQMGYGRAGWYSYDRLDNAHHSAERILAEHQSLAVGDIIPTWPGGGFRVAAIEPGKSLVLYLDTELVAKQAEAAAASAEPSGEAMAANLKMAGAMGGAAMPEFKASWAFVLQPIDANRTRIIERFRVWAPDASGPQRAILPLFGIGVFLMTRKQLLGLKERAERTAVAPPMPGLPGMGAAAAA
jgi:hypothetical protein